MNQTEKVLEFMKEHYGITTYESTYILGITRLSARISDLRDAGYIINDQWVDRKNTDGEKIHVKLYSYIGKAVDVL
jgi:hypothetical protein